MAGEMTAPYEMNKQVVATIKATVFPNANNAELSLFFHQCRRLGVHPLDRLIHPVKRGSSDGDRVSFQTSIDYFRSAADNTGEYDGQDEPEFGKLIDDKYPEFATVKVYRKGINRPFVGTARWSEYYPGEKLGFMWRKMPHNQLAKCAEALALRKAFPQNLHGLYTDDEMLQADFVEEPEKKTSTVQRKSETPASNGDVVTTAQVRAINTMLGKAGVKDDQRHTFVASMIGHKIESMNNLTKAEASTVIDRLQNPDKNEEPLPEGVPTDCPKDPMACEHSGFAEGKAFCGPDGDSCAFQVKE